MSTDNNEKETSFKRTMTIVFGRPEVKPRIVALILKLLMILGVIGIICSALSALYYAGCGGLQLLLNEGVFEDYIDYDKIEILQFYGLTALYYSMLASVLYGFASFLWFKLSAARIFGKLPAFIFFLFIPVVLIVLTLLHKWYQIEIGPVEYIEAVSKYYPFVWFVLIFLIGTVFPMREKTRMPINPFARYSVLVLLCYLPYAYVLFLGEQVFLADVMSGYFGYFLNAQLIVFALLPIR